MVDNMRNFLTKYLKTEIKIKKYTADNRLPLAVTGLFELFQVGEGELHWLLVEAKENAGLIQIRKANRQIQKACGQYAVFAFDEMPYYMADKFLEEGIPFVVKDKQIYLPFLGMMIEQKKERVLAPVMELSFLAQKLLLMAMYEKWGVVSVTKAAEKMGVSKMSISRCFDEYEVLGMPVLTNNGRYRAMKAIGSDVVLKQCREYLRTPVIKRIFLKKDRSHELEYKAGMSALCEYSMLDDNDYPTFGVLKKDMKGLGITKHDAAAPGDEIGCEILELGYMIKFNGKQIMDPVSVALALFDERQEDDRVEIAVKEMFGEYL